MELTTIEKNILIKLQTSDRVTRNQLSKLTGLSDRKNRVIINQMRKKHVPIISSSQSKGYWLASNDNECKNIAKELTHYANDIMAVANGIMHKKAKEYYKGADDSYKEVIK